MLAKNIKEFEKRRIKLISIAKDSPIKMKQVCESLKNPIQLIADKRGKISRQYGVLLTKGNSLLEFRGLEQALPSKFLINKEGCIVWKDLAPGKERPSLEVILDAIDTHL